MQITNIMCLSLNILLENMSSPDEKVLKCVHTLSHFSITNYKNSYIEITCSWLSFNNDEKNIC